MRKKVLVIEDEMIQVLLLQSCLEMAGYEVVTASSGEQGLDKALAHNPDLILLDIILPGITGIEVCKRLKELPETKDIHILFVTASTMQGLEERCKVFGIDGCIAKPYEPAELLGRIRELFSVKDNSLPSSPRND